MRCMAGVGCTRALARAHISRRIDATAWPVAARAAAGPAVLYRRAVDVCTLFAPARWRSVSPFAPHCRLPCMQHRVMRKIIVALLQLKKARESWPLWGALLTFLSDDTTELRSSFQHRRQQDMAARKEEGKTAKRDESDVGKHPNLTRSSTAPGSLAIGDGKQEEFTIHVQKWPVYAGSPRWPVSCRPSTTLAQFCENVAAVAKLPIGQICLLKGDVKLGKDSMASALCDLGLGEGTSLVLKLGSF